MTVKPTTSADSTRDASLVSLLWAGPEMAGEIASLHAGLFDPPWDTAGVARLLEHPGSTSLIARTGFPKVSVGFILGQIAADEAEVLSVGVKEDWQRLGLGRRLVEGLIRSLVRASVKRVYLEVAEDNAAAIALYRRCGFAEASRRKGYYVRPGRPAADALVLAKPL